MKHAMAFNWHNGEPFVGGSDKRKKRPSICTMFHNIQRVSAIVDSGNTLNNLSWVRMAVRVRVEQYVQHIMSCINCNSWVVSNAHLRCSFISNHTSMFLYFTNCPPSRIPSIRFDLLCSRLGFLILSPFTGRVHTNPLTRKELTLNSAWTIETYLRTLRLGIAPSLKKRGRLFTWLAWANPTFFVHH